jgi:PAS domain S-box-containing protein
VSPLPAQTSEEHGPAPSRRLSYACGCLGLAFTVGLGLLAHDSAQDHARGHLEEEFASLGTVLEVRLERLLRGEWPSIASLFAAGDRAGAERAARHAMAHDRGLVGLTLLEASGALGGSTPGYLTERLQLGSPSGKPSDLFLDQRADRLRSLAHSGGQWLDLAPPEAPAQRLRLYLAPAPRPESGPERAVLVLEIEPLAWLGSAFMHVDGVELRVPGDTGRALHGRRPEAPESRLEAWLRPTTQARVRFQNELGDFELCAYETLQLGGLAGLTLALAVGGGLALTMLAFGATRSLEARHEAVRREVRERTRALRREISEREQAEQRLEDIVATADEYLWESDLAPRFTFLTRPIEGVLARTVSDLLGRSPLELMPPDRARRIAAWWQEIIDERRSFKDLELEMCRPDGSCRWVRISGAPVFDRTGSLIGFRGTGLDITEARLASERLSAQRRELQLILDAVPAMVFYKDAHNRILRVNRAVAEALGKPVDQIEGRRADELFPPADAARYLSQDREVIESGRSRLGIVERLEDGHGQRRFTQVDKIPLPVEAFGEPRVVSVVTDISQRQRLEQQLELALRSSGLTLWDWDLRGDRLELGSGWTRMLGHDRTPRDLAGWLEHAVDEDRLATAERLEQWIAGAAHGEQGSLRHELRMLDSAGAPRWVLTILEVADRDSEGRPLRICGVQVDIHELKASQRRLDEARQAAEAASRAKSEFLANMSHEIRTPMNAILGFTDLLDQTGLPEPERRDYLQTIRRSGQSLLALINDILDLSKIESGRLMLEQAPFDLPSELEHLRRTLVPLAKAKNLELRVELAVDAPQRLITDPARLQQILINLLGNAIKFTHSGWVALRARGRDGRLCLEIEDTGIGIAPEKIAEIFQPFCQGDSSTTRRFGGTGLGLTISRRLAELLGGRLDVRSAPGEGSTFTLELPLGQAPGAAGPRRLPEESEILALESGPGLASGAPSEQPAAAPIEAGGPAATSGSSEAADGRPLSGRRVLVVDDGEDNRRLCRLILQRAGAQVELAQDGQEAVERLLQGSCPPFDLVLLDMQMPRLDGYSTAAELRRLGLGLPVIALTAHAMEGDREKCLRAGCDDFATKPVRAQELIALCSRWLQSGQRRKAA